MMDEFLPQLAFSPDVRRPFENPQNAIVVGGMGGSALAGEALLFLEPARRILIHRDYGLPWEAPKDALHLALSYSGNTEETLSFANAAITDGRDVAVVASGGKLAEFAEREGLPLALVPAGLAPRNAFMYLVRAALSLTGREEVLANLSAVQIDEEALAERSEEDAHAMLQHVPLFYTSARNRLVGQMAKLIVNESARTPAFANVFPELNHNEMQAFDTDMPEGLEHLFGFFLVRDPEDSERIVRRMDALTDLMEERGRHMHRIDLAGSRAEALANVWLRLIGVGRRLAETRGIDPNTAPLVEAFKKRL